MVLKFAVSETKSTLGSSRIWALCETLPTHAIFFKTCFVKTFGPQTFCLFSYMFENTFWYFAIYEAHTRLMYKYSHMTVTHDHTSPRTGTNQALLVERKNNESRFLCCLPMVEMLTLIFFSFTLSIGISPQVVNTSVGSQVSSQGPCYFPFYSSLLLLYRL